MLKEVEALNQFTKKMEKVSLNLKQRSSLLVFGSAKASDHDNLHIVKCENCKKYYLDEVHGMSFGKIRFECPHCGYWKQV